MCEPRQCRNGPPRIRARSIFKPRIDADVRRGLPYQDKVLQPKPFILPQHAELRNKLFLSFQGRLFSCLGTTPTVNVWAVSTLVCFWLPAVRAFATVCRVKTQSNEIAAGCVRFSEQNQFQRQIATDQSCKPLAVSSCLDEPDVRGDQVLGFVVQVPFAVGELPPELVLRSRLAHAFAPGRAAQEGRQHNHAQRGSRCL